MKKPTEKQIAKEIQTLKTMKPNIVRYSMFGDDNHAKIDAQIEVLEERLSEDEVYNRFEDSDNPDRTYDLVSCARYAAEWLIGQAEDGVPSKGWEGLAKVDTTRKAGQGK
jgi:hypothetical protein